MAPAVVLLTRLELGLAGGADGNTPEGISWTTQLDVIKKGCVSS